MKPTPLLIYEQTYVNEKKTFYLEVIVRKVTQEDAGLSAGMPFTFNGF